MTNKITIILLTYNNIDKTKKCIESLYKYSSNFFLSIRDNGSSDGTKKYLIQQAVRLRNNVSVTFRNKNDGIIIGRNKDYRACIEFNKISDYIFFIDNDQTVSEGWQDSYLEMMKNYDLVGCEAWKMQKNFYPYKRITDPNDSSSYVGVGGLMIKKEVIDKIGLFDERYAPCYFEDPDFCFTAHQNGFKIGWDSKPVIIHNHKGPLLSKENKIHFMNSWKKFQEKWKDFEVPQFPI
ncbi:hypothetical protein LCGC14_2747560 [marine sediment metagenome]|uniref:Glycosyltransferase 2-like domain-containing protein n=1 Tax=marine sediment metagenome TaxID=412755 RepID=A0A0F8ZPR7_9ZZZZ